MVKPGASAIETDAVFTNKTVRNLQHTESDMGSHGSERHCSVPKTRYARSGHLAWLCLSLPTLFLADVQVHHRIPNFQGADEAAERLATLPEFQSAQLVKVNPDTPQRQASLKSDYDNVLPRNANLLPLGSTIGSSKRQNFIDTTTSPEDWILLHAETRHGRDTFHHADREANIIEGCGKIRHADHLV